MAVFSAISSLIMKSGVFRCSSSFFTISSAFSSSHIENSMCSALLRMARSGSSSDAMMVSWCFLILSLTPDSSARRDM